MRRVLKISAWAVGTLISLVLVLSSAVLLVANTDDGRRLIERLTEQLSDGQVTLSGLGGSFPSALDLERLQLSDRRGVWLVAEHISLRWSPPALLSRHIQVDSLTAARVHVERQPVPDPESKPSNFSIPRTDLTRLSVERLELGSELVGTPVSLVVEGSAHLSSLQDAIAHVTAKRTGGDGDYELQLKFDPARMDAMLKLREPANGPLENLLGLPGLGALSVVANLNGPRSAEIIQLVVDAGPLRARAQGSVNLVDVSADLDYSLEAPEMSPSPGLSWKRVALHGRWHGTVTTPAADGRLEVEQLQLPGSTRLASVKADLKADRGLLAARAVLDGLSIPGPQPKLLQGGPLTLDASMRLNEDTRPLELTATHKLFDLRAQAVTAGKLSARLKLRLPDLAPWAALGGQKVKGSADIQAQVSGDSETQKLILDANAAINGGKAVWAGVLGKTVRLQLSGSLTDKRLSIESLQLTGRTLSVAASGIAERSIPQKVKARWDVTLRDLRSLSPSLAGSMKLSGKVSGPTNALSLDADVTSTLSIRESSPGTVAASVHADGLPSAPRGTVEAHGDLDGAPLRLNVSLERTSARSYHALIRHADWKSAHVEGDVTSGSDISQAQGHLKLSMEQLADLQDLVGTPIRGSIAGTLEMTPGKGHTHAQLQLEARDVTTGSFVANAQLAAEGPLDALNLDVSLQSPAVGGQPLTLTATAQLDTSESQLHLNTAEASYRNQKLQLLSPATVSFAEGLSIDGLKLGALSAVIEADGRISPTLDLHAALHELKPELINAFNPGLLASGKVEAEAQLQGSLAAPEGHFQMQAVDIRSANDAARGLPPATVNAKAELKGNTADVSATLSAGSASQMTLTGHAPLAMDGALDLKLAGSLDLGLLNPIVEGKGKHVTGALTVDTTVTGDPAAPEIGGTIRLAKGSLRDYAQGINLSDITAELQGAHGTLRIVSMTARAAPGTLSAAGTIGILQPKWPVDLTLTARNAQPITNNIVTANVDADLTLKGTARERLDLGGNIRINRANVEIPSSLPPNVAVLDVRRPGQTKPPPPEKPLVIGLNVTVDAPRQILVQGRGLDAELGGQIRIRGTTDSPVVTGSFDLQRGTFALASNHLTFSSGSVRFNGEGLKNKIDPTLDFTAQTQVLDVTAIVRITGLADAPKIELTSTPELPQDEILARLLFGESGSQLTALQVVQIGAALATLGGGGGLNPVAKIQKALGLDRLSVAGGTGTGPAGAANTGASIEAGRYVSSRVFVAVKESTTGSSQLAVDVDLTKHLKLQTRLGNGQATAQGTTPENDPGSSVGLAYQFEY